MKSSAHQFFAEFIGTALLLTTVVGSGIMGERLADGNTAVALLANSIATGCMLYVLITLFGPLSGAHFNPLVSLRACLQKQLGAKSFAAYLSAQLLGAIAGVVLAHAMFELPLIQQSQHVRSGYGQWIAEAMATFGLLLVIGLGERFKREQIAALVASYITAAYWFTASTSFANPIVTVARALTDTFAGIAPSSVLWFVTAQVAGFALAISVLVLLRNEKDSISLSTETMPAESI